MTIPDSQTSSIPLKGNRICFEYNHICFNFLNNMALQYESQVPGSPPSAFFREHGYFTARVETSMQVHWKYYLSNHCLNSGTFSRATTIWESSMPSIISFNRLFDHAKIFVQTSYDTINLLLILKNLVLSNKN